MGGFFKESSVITLHYITFYLTQATSVFYPGTFWGEVSPPNIETSPQEISVTPAVKLKIMSILDRHLLLNVSCFNIIK